jgi:tRNA A37 methylthiotransferase MiaB
MVTAEEMLKKALEFANQGMKDNKLSAYDTDDYHGGLYYAYEDMAAHLEMLIKEAKQNG